MGIAASLFHSANDSEKQTLHRRITPSDEQFEEQQDRWNALADHLLTDLKDRAGHTVRSWLQGSYKFGTQIRPCRRSDDFDIDLGVYYQWDGKPAEGRHGPKTLKSFVQDSLQAYSRINSTDVREVSIPKERCCRIHFKNSFHIDVPAYHLNPNRDARSLATESGIWETSDPKAIYIWFRNHFDDLTRAKIRRQVKYVKAWAALKFLTDARPSSILLTVLVADAAKAIGPSNIGADDDTLCDIVERIVDRLDVDIVVANPVDKSENLARLNETHMKTFRERIRSFMERSKLATSKDDEIAAVGIWQEAFEHLFPMPDLQGANIKANLPMPFTMPEIRVTAIARTNPTVGRFTGVNAIGPIPKDCDITFDLTNRYAIPAHAQILWMVRNEGHEAENINDLGHNAGTGFSATEHSAYRGTHYMDCVVKVAGKIVAIRRVPVTITGQVMPRRNPKRRPEWVKLRGRR